MFKMATQFHEYVTKLQKCVDLVETKTSIVPSRPRGKLRFPDDDIQKAKTGSWVQSSKLDFHSEIVPSCRLWLHDFSIFEGSALRNYHVDSAAAFKTATEDFEVPGNLCNYFTFYPRELQPTNFAVLFNAKSTRDFYVAFMSAKSSCRSSESYEVEVGRRRDVHEEHVYFISKGFDVLCKGPHDILRVCITI
jgi:hypothetical protein